MHDTQGLLILLRAEPDLTHRPDEEVVGGMHEMEELLREKK